MVRILSCLAVFVSVAASAGCAESPPSGPVGYINIPLTATGAGGETYHLPLRTGLTLGQSGLAGIFYLDDQAGSGSGSSSGSTATSQTIEVLPGDYSVGLVDPAGDTTIWPLTRIQPDGTTDLVLGTLDIQPTITVTDQQTTPLVIRFHLGTPEPIRFGSGAVDVSILIDQSAATIFEFGLSVPFALTSVVVGDNAPAALAARLPAQGDSPDGYAVTLHTTGQWSRVNSSRVCVPVAGSDSIGGNLGLNELVLESQPMGSQDLCIEQVGPQQASLTMSFSRLGAGNSPLLSDLGDRQYAFSHSFEIDVAADLFNGSTLDLRPLSPGIQAGVLLTAGIIAQTASGFDTWYTVNEAGTSTLSFRGY